MSTIPHMSFGAGLFPRPVSYLVLIALGCKFARREIWRDNK